MTQYIPTQAGFTAWIRSAMGITTDQLPDDSEWITYAYNVSMAIVPCDWACVSQLIYMLAVYNLGGDNLLNWAQDVPPSTFFADARASFGINNFTAGVVSQSSDESSSTSIDTIEALKTVTIGQLQNLKTPYGRQYLTWAMSMGTNWGLS